MRLLLKTNGVRIGLPKIGSLNLKISENFAIINIESERGIEL